MPGSLKLLNEFCLVNPQLRPDRKGRTAIEAVWHARVDLRLLLDVVQRQPGREAQCFTEEIQTTYTRVGWRLKCQQALAYEIANRLT